MPAIRARRAFLRVAQALVLIKLPVAVAPWTFCRVVSNKLCKLLELVDVPVELPCPDIKLSRLCCSDDSVDVLELLELELELELLLSLAPPKIVESDDPLELPESNSEASVDVSEERT